MNAMIIAFIDAAGAVCFLVAFIWGMFNSAHEAQVSEFWLAYSTAMLVGFAFAAMKATQWFGVPPFFTDAIQPFLATVLATILLITAVVCIVSPMERTVK